jgi:peptidoglycan biosynthesis protein MviN/MurJ (putative lipid II flippase)
MRGFYAQRDTRLPFLVNLAETLLGLAIAFAVVDRFGVVGLGASGSIAYCVFAVVALYLLHRRIGRYLDSATILAITKLLAATVVMAVGVGVLINFVSMSDLLTIVLAGALGIILYAGMLVLLRVDEAKSVVSRLVSR